MDWPSLCWGPCFGSRPLKLIRLHEPPVARPIFGPKSDCKARNRRMLEAAAGSGRRDSRLRLARWLSPLVLRAPKTWFVGAEKRANSSRRLDFHFRCSRFVIINQDATCFSAASRFCSALVGTSRAEVAPKPNDGRIGDTHTLNIGQILSGSHNQLRACLGADECLQF